MTKQAENAHVTPNSDADEIASLKSRLDLMGVKYHHKAGVKKLRAAIAESVEDLSSPEPSVTPAPYPSETVMETLGARNARLRQEAGALIRVVVACMNPEKRDWEGETYSVGNSIVGQFKKYVPFNNDEGWHVPQIVLNHMLEKQCQIWVNKKNERGEKVKVGKLINELNVQILPALSEQALAELGQRQAMSHSIDD